MSHTKRSTAAPGHRAIIALLVVGSLMAQASTAGSQPGAGPVVTETHTQTQRSLMGGFWQHSTSTKTTTAVPQIIAMDDVETGTLMFSTDVPGQYAEAMRMDTRASIDITGMIARVVVTQSFVNSSDNWVEGIYAFPLPEDAAVDALKMRIGEIVIEGAIMEKLQARQAYERAKHDGTRASLVEQTRPNLFQTAVANIAPRDTIAVEISYLETLRYDEGEFSLRFPLSITPRFSPDRLSAGMLPSSDPVSVAQAAPPPPTSLAEIDVRLDAGFPLRKVYSDSHDVSVTQRASIHHLTLSDGAVPMDRDFELRWRPAIGAEPGAAIFTEDLDGSTYAKIMFMPPRQRGVDAAMPREIVIIVDTSGSMSGASFSQAVSAVTQALGLLSDQDYFNLVRFSSSHSSLFERARPATRANLDAARRFLGRLRAEGGTNMAPPLAEALMQDSGAGLLKQVVFITDGAVDNERELFGLIHRELQQTRLFTVGIGAAPNSYFMRKAAETGRGTYTYISSTRQVEERMQGLFRKLESPVLRDIEVQWPGSRTEATPLHIPDLYLTEPLIVSARLDGKASAIRVSASQSGRSWSRELSLDRGLDFRGVSTLWARDKVALLMDGLARGARPEQVRAEVVPLALKHHLVTRYTSLVALDDRPVRPSNEELKRPSSATPATLQANGKQISYPATATGYPLRLAIGLLLVIAALALRPRSRRRQ